MVVQRPLDHENSTEGLKSPADGEIDAFVYDEPLIRYLIHKAFATKLEVLPQVFERQDYGITLPHGSPLREPINRILLKKIKGRPWQDILYRYLGQA